MRLLQEALRREGMDAVLCSRFVLGSAFNRIRPDLVFLPKSHKIPNLEEIHRQATVALVSAESFSGSAQAIRDLVKSSIAGWRSDLVDLVFCWGKVDYETFIEEKVFPSAKLFETGHPNTEVWYKPRVPRKDSKKTLGLTTALRVLTHVGRSTNPVEMVSQIEVNGDNGFFEPPYHAEACIAFEAAWIRLIHQIVNEFKDCRILIRPHPIEDPTLYKYFEKWSHVEVGNNQDIVTWLDQVDVMLSYLSTSQMDAHLRGVNVVSLRGLFPPEVLRGVPSSMIPPLNDHYFAPTTLEGVRNALDVNQNDRVALNQFAERVFRFPADVRPSSAIAKAVADHARKSGLRKAPFKALPETGIARFLPSFLPIDHVRVLKGDLQGSHLNRANFGHSYCWHRFGRNKERNQMVSLLLPGPS